MTGYKLSYRSSPLARKCRPGVSSSLTDAMNGRVDAHICCRQASMTSGTWNSIHVIEAKVSDTDKKARSAHRFSMMLADIIARYKLTTTVMLSLDASCKVAALSPFLPPSFHHQGNGSQFDLSGSLTRTMERERPFADKVSDMSDDGRPLTRRRGRLATWRTWGRWWRRWKEGCAMRCMRFTLGRQRRNMQMNLMAEMMKRKAT
eukprot:761073-Hanusia_phi.AAC.1